MLFFVSSSSSAPLTAAFNISSSVRVSFQLKPDQASRRRTTAAVRQHNAVNSNHAEYNRRFFATTARAAAVQCIWTSQMKSQSAAEAEVVSTATGTAAR
jgi:hypothetical protein